MWIGKELNATVPAAIRIRTLTEQELEELRERYKDASDSEERSRYQMVLLSAQGHAAPEIAGIVLRSRDTVLRVLRRYEHGGVDAVPKRTAPGRERTVTPEWEGELLRVIELSPREVGMGSANWTTGLLSRYLAEVTGIEVGAERVRHYLHAHKYVCKRPTWTLARKASEQPEWEGKG